jgi:CysZ protein
MFSYIKGLLDCFGGFTLIFKSGVKRYVLVPLAVNTVLFGGAIWLLREQIQAWIEQLLPEWLSWLEWLIWPLFALTVLLLVFYSFSLLANLISAPFNSLLAASVEKILTGSKPEDFSSEALWKIAVRSFASELRKMLYFVKWLIPLLILTMIPVVNVIAPFAWFVFAAWSFSLEYMDYPLGNRGMLFEDIRDYNRHNRMRSLGLGTGVFLLTSIPVINFLAMPVAVCAATRLTTRTIDNAKAPR